MIALTRARNIIILIDFLYFKIINLIIIYLTAARDILELFNNFIIYINIIDSKINKLLANNYSAY